MKNQVEHCSQKENNVEVNNKYKDLSVRNLLRYFVNGWLPIIGIHLHLRANVSGLRYWYQQK